VGDVFVKRLAEGLESVDGVDRITDEDVL